MNRFFHSIWPATIPAQVNPADEIAVLRERILQALLLTSLFVAAIVLILVFPTYMQIQRWALLGMYCFFLVFMSVMTFVRRIPYIVRATSLLFVIYMIGLGSCLSYGLSGNGPVLLAAFVSITAIFLGLTSSIAAGVFALATMWVIGFLMTQNLIPPPAAAVQANSAVFSEWFTRSLVVSLVGTFFILTLTILITGLRKSILTQRQLTTDLVKERDLLENRVVERTSELEKRANELETASAISKDISQITNLDDLLPAAVERIKADFNFYYVGLFLIDDHHEFAVLRAGTGEAGLMMMGVNHRLKIAETSMVGFTIVKKEARLAQDVDQDPVHYKNPFLPETKSELSLPLIASGQAIGALNVQSEQARYFQPNDVRVLQIAADQLAVAIEKAQLVQQLTKTLDDLRLSYRQTTQQAWQGFMRSTRRNYSFQMHRGQVEAIDTTSPQANEAISLGRPITSRITAPDSGKQTCGIAVPIKLRDQVLGVIDLRFDVPNVPQDLIEMLEAASNRMALALENARLLEEIQMRANREHMVGSIISKVRAESEIDRVLQTVAAELGRSLGVSGVLVELRETEK
jgi:GAF domain-containing protein